MGLGVSCIATTEQALSSKQQGEPQPLIPGLGGSHYVPQLSPEVHTLSLSACLVGAGEVLAEISVKTWSPPTAMTSDRTTV